MSCNIDLGNKAVIPNQVPVEARRSSTSKSLTPEETNLRDLPKKDRTSFQPNSLRHLPHLPAMIALPPMTDKPTDLSTNTYLEARK